LERLPTEQPHRDSQDLDVLTTPALLEVIQAADSQIAGAVALAIPQIAAAVEAIAAVLSRAGRLRYIGAGSSGRLGVLDAAECPPTFGVAPDLVRGILAGGDRALVEAVEGVEDDAAAGARDLVGAGFDGGDAVVGIAASGRTPYVLGAMAQARGLEAVTCGISCCPDSELSRAVAYPIEVVTGPEVLTGSTRMRAGTATKMVLNMISTAVMVRIGYVYGNLMVNVQPSNQKLEARARGIIAQAVPVAAEEAGALLEKAGRSVAVAIVMGKKKVSRTEAEGLLRSARGSVREALK